METSKYAPRRSLSTHYDRYISTHYITPYASLLPEPSPINRGHPSITPLSLPLPSLPSPSRRDPPPIPPFPFPPWSPPIPPLPFPLWSPPLLPTTTHVQQRGLDDLPQLVDLLLTATHVAVSDVGLLFHLHHGDGRVDLRREWDVNLVLVAVDPGRWWQTEGRVTVGVLFSHISNNATAWRVHLL